MKFGNASWGFRELSMEEQLKITHDMGLGYLELGIANAPKDLPLSVSQEELEQVKVLYEKYDVELLYAATGNDFTTGNKDDVDKIRKVIDICEKLGVKYLRIFSGFSPVEEVVDQRWDNMITCIKEVNDYAQSHGVYLVIETHGGVNEYEDGVEHFMSTSAHTETLYKMLRELPETVKVNFDPANLWAVGIRHPEEVYESCMERVAMVHLKDFEPLPSGHVKPAVCGASEMDWKAIMEALKGYEGVALFEYENTENVKEGSMQCYAYINTILDLDTEDNDTL